MRKDTSKHELMWLNIKYTIIGVLAWIGLLCIIALVMWLGFPFAWL